MLVYDNNLRNSIWILVVKVEYYYFSFVFFSFFEYVLNNELKFILVVIFFIILISSVVDVVKRICFFYCIGENFKFVFNEFV